jgi:hypothetical protein
LMRDTGESQQSLHFLDFSSMSSRGAAIEGSRGVLAVVQQHQQGQWQRSGNMLNAGQAVAVTHCWQHPQCSLGPSPRGSPSGVAVLRSPAPHTHWAIVLLSLPAGKTTLLRLVAGLEQPTAGRILFDDLDATNLPVQDRQVSSWGAAGGEGCWQGSLHFA